MEKGVLEELNGNDILNSLAYARSKGFDHTELIGVINSLALDKYVVVTANLKQEELVLTDEGKSYRKHGSPEAQVYHLVKSSPLTQEQILSQLGGIGKIGFAQAMKNKWISINKETKVLSPAVEEIQDKVQQALLLIPTEEENKDLQGVKPAELAEENKDLDQLIKRKLVENVKRGYCSLTKGPSFRLEREKFEADITYETLKSGAWKTASFKDYNFKSLGKDTNGGHLHPLLKVRAQLRRILLDMGFEEMPTNNFVESSFWNFDSLFQPQSHPARDAHDTFFIKDPAYSSNPDKEYVERVKKMHEAGNKESIGWLYKWSLEESEKNILRTHTTAVSSRMLYRLAKDGFRPKKYFSIDRVFRNENLDATHLAEFHQIEGLIADIGLGLGDLMGIIQEFFRRMGITNIKFKPAYNPYTEPSLEIFGYHPLLKKWTEIGNSGVFRPEMLEPMGLPDNVSVIAWGLSLERPTMIQYGIDNIRNLFGSKADLTYIQDNPICRYNR
jgi:phenylalanyl-tRNA synthetase alpha chain